MTYFQFHLLFNLPALVVLLLLARRRLQATHWKWISLICAGVFVLVTPWDNWAVYRGIWSFDWERVTPVVIPAFGIEWKLPAEEYGFFLVETILVSLLTVLFLPRRSAP